MEEPVLAAAKLEGGMIALRPATPLTVKGGDPAEQVHVTLAFVAEDASELDEFQVNSCHRAAMRLATSFHPLLATVAGYAALGTGEDPGIVLLLNGFELQPAHSVLWADLDSLALPEQHQPWIPHMTLGYGIDVESGKQFVGETVILDRVTVDIGGEQFSYPLVGQPLQVPPMNEEDFEASVAIVAAIAEITRPAEWFIPIKLPDPQRWTTVTADGETWGHTAIFGECHIGYPGKCVTPELITQGGFDYANGIGHVVTADGLQVGTSPIAVKGGHAPLEWDWERAKAHYDDPSTVVADVVYGIDDHGITFHGGIRPTATPEMIYAFRASGVSGDWREIEGMTRFLASCCVNNGGFPKMKARVNKAEDRVLAMVAAGGEAEPDPTLKCCGDIEVVEEGRIDATEITTTDGNVITLSAASYVPLVTSTPDLEERLAKVENLMASIYRAHQEEVLASLADRLTDA